MNDESEWLIELINDWMRKQYLDSEMFWVKQTFNNTHFIPRRNLEYDISS